MLGEVILEQEGKGLFGAEEIRILCKSLRFAYGPELDERLRAKIERMDGGEAGCVVRAFLVCFQLVNVAERYGGWAFFKTLVDFMQMTLAKSDMRIAKTYASLVGDDGVRERVWEPGEHALCVRALLNITGQDHLLDGSPILQRSIRLRNPYVEPLYYIQVNLLKRLRALPEGSPEREAVPSPLLLTVSAVSSGLLNTG